MPTPSLFRATKLLLALGLLASSLPARAQLFPNLGGQRVGISGLTFLKNDLSPRSTAMGGANVTLSGDAYAAVLNPAIAAEAQAATIGASSLMYGSGLNHSLVTGTLPIKNAGNVYANFHMLNMGSEAVRTEFFPNGTGDYFAAYSMAAEVGYAKSLSERFSVGVGIKYIREQLAQYAANAVAADIGFLYRVDWHGLRFGAALQNFGTNSTLKGNYSPDVLQKGTTTQTEGYPAPTLFKMGASMDAINDGVNLLTVHAQLNHPNDNAENIRIGAEYVWTNTLAIRAGLKLGVDNERVPTFGIGYQQPLGGHTLHLDYGVNPTRYLGFMHSVGLSFVFGKQDAAPMQATPTTTP